MTFSKTILPLAAALALAACRIEITVPEGGRVTTDSGNFACAAESTCTVDVEDTNFAETFMAVPDDGFVFAGWQVASRTLCGGRLGTCELDASLLANNPAGLALLESDEVFYLTPQFFEAGEIGIYQFSDRVQFSGRLDRDSATSAPESAAVTAELSFSAPTFALLPWTVMVANLELQEVEGDETGLVQVHFYQGPSGAAAQVTDPDGLRLTNPASATPGAFSVPTPLEPGYRRDLQYDGHRGATPISTIERIVEVGQSEALTVPAGTFDTFPVTITDDIAYLQDDGEFSANQRVRRETTLWISPVKVIVRIEVSERVLTPNGRLLRTSELALDASRFNY
jgi:hypothetical protein